MITYWLWYGTQIVSSVRLPEGSSADTVRSHALMWHERVPLCDWPLEAPFERRDKILHATIRTYPGGN